MPVTIVGNPLRTSRINWIGAPTDGGAALRAAEERTRARRWTSARPSQRIEPAHDHLHGEVREQPDGEQNRTEVEQRRRLQAGRGTLIARRDLAGDRVARAEDV